MSKHPFLGKFPEEVGCELSPIIRDYPTACNHGISSVSIQVSIACRSENVHVAQVFTYCLISTDMLG